MSYQTDERGRRSVVIRNAGSRRRYLVHTLVALAFLGPKPEGQEVAHENGDETDARASNLRYATHVDNCADKIKHGTYQAKKLDNEIVCDIRFDVLLGDSINTVAERYDVHPNSVKRIVTGETWGHIRYGLRD